MWRHLWCNAVLVQGSAIIGRSRWVEIGEEEHSKIVRAREGGDMKSMRTDFSLDLHHIDQVRILKG